jgi:YD repeat-containing protein
MKKLVIPVLLLLMLQIVSASEWYRSNSGGLALESLASVRALREEYALEVTTIEYKNIPEILKSIEKNASSIIAEYLYYKKQIILRRYKLYDAQKQLRLASQFTNHGFAWIERYDSKRRLYEEYWSFDASSWYKKIYYFIKERPSKSQTFVGNFNQDWLPLSTDIYRYDRTGFLRTIERNMLSDKVEPGTTEWFSREVPSLTTVNQPGPGSSGIPSISSVDNGTSIIYSLDAQGRVVQEQHKNKAGIIEYEKMNTWEKDRLSAVLITEKGTTTKIEYTYDSQGNRIGEKYYSGSELVRQIFIEGNKETEELYDKGRLLLRTIWVDGVKQSEYRPDRPIIQQ